MTKRVLIAFFVLFGTLTAHAQLPDGSIAPNFTITDIDGNDHELYDYLGMGYTVVLDLSATWCGPCWNYHNTGALQTLHEQHGVENGGNVVVIFIEGDPQTTTEDLMGTGQDTWGNWVAGKDYVISEDAFVANLYEISGFPTVFTICPTGYVTETGPRTASQHWNFINTNSCQNVPANDAALLGYEGVRESCEGTEVDFDVELLNMGEEPLTSATFSITGTASPITYNWTGNLAPFESTLVNFSGILSSDINASIGTDANQTNNSIAGPEKAPDATTWLRFDIKFDAWPEECSWNIQDENGNTIFSGGPYNNQADNSTLVFDRYLPGEGCYTVNVFDEFGDGLHGSIWGSQYQDGHFYVRALENGTVVSTIFSNPGTLFYTAANEVAHVTGVVSVEELQSAQSMQVFPNPASDEATLEFSLTGRSDVRYELVSTIGSVARTGRLGELGSGRHSHTLDVSDLPSGMYILNCSVGAEWHTLRLNVQR